MDFGIPTERVDSPPGGAALRPDGAGHLTRRTLVFVMAGGRGTRLKQLTDWRAKPAVLFGSRHCVIDFTLANCVNSGLRRIAVLTQYKAQSLIRHLQTQWPLNRRFGDFLEIVPAQQRTGEGWYAGTADAVGQNLDLVRRLRPAYVVILAGDHVYKMDYTVMLAEHVAKQAEVTVACVEVPIEEASAFGVLQIDAQERVTGWEEKPQAPTPVTGSGPRALASMGIYVFNAATLLRALEADAKDDASSHDFGHDVVPGMVRAGLRIHAHSFGRSCVGAPGSAPYWRDVGTLDAYWAANIELTRGDSGCDLFDRRWPIPTTDDSGRPSKFLTDERGAQAVLTDCVIGSGCTIGAATIHRSVLFSDLCIGHGARIEESLVLSESEVGAGARLQRVIVDKYCRLPPGLEVGFDTEQDRRRFHVTRGGITLVTPEMLDQRSPLESARDRRGAGTPVSSHPLAVPANCRRSTTMDRNQEALVTCSKI